MILRKISPLFLKALAQFPVVVITGARQVGKSTLCREALKDSHNYVSLEDPNVRARALDDPKTFLLSHKAPIIIDEIQYVPNLVHYIQTLVDQNRQSYGQYVLTGSQNFLLMQQVSQSLAGRAMLLDLYALSALEISNQPPTNPQPLAELILRGQYPELWARSDLDSQFWMGSYIRLYLERDVRQILKVDDLQLFERFIKLTAVQTGQVLNQSRLASDVGVSVPTIKRWLSLLEASYQIVLLPAFQTNLKKRITKAPKLYFCDTGIASYLMGFSDTQSLLASPHFGALFETLVVMENMKQRSFTVKPASPHFFRTQDGLEVDLLTEHPLYFQLDEIKANRTVNPHWKNNLEKTAKLFDKKFEGRILCPIQEEVPLSANISAVPWWQV